jgi:hypothetical protein
VQVQATNKLAKEGEYIRTERAAQSRPPVCPAKKGSAIHFSVVQLPQLVRAVHAYCCCCCCYVIPSFLFFVAVCVLCSSDLCAVTRLATASPVGLGQHNTDNNKAQK